MTPETDRQPITDPLLIAQLNATAGNADVADRKPVTDPLLIEQLNRATRQSTLTSRLTGRGDISAKQASAREMANDIFRQGGYGLVQGAVALPNLAYKGIDWATGHRLPSLEDSPTYKALHDEAPQAETAAGRYAHRIGEYAGGAVLPGAGLYGLAAKFPTTWGLRSIAAAGPRAAATVEGTAALGGGAAAQTAEEMGAEPLGQTIAGLAGGFAAPFAGVPTVQRFSRALRAGPDPGTWTGESGALRTGPVPSLPEPQAPLGSTTRPRPPASPEVEDRALRVIADRLIQRGMTQKQWADEAQAAEASHVFHSTSEMPSAQALADINDTTQRLAASQVRLHPGAAREARPFLTARQTGETPVEGLSAEAGLTTYPRGDERLFGRSTVDAEPAGQLPRTIEAGRRVLGIQDMRAHGFQETAERTANAITAAQEAAATKSYGNVRVAGQGVNLRNEPKLVEGIDALKARLAEGPPAEEASLIKYALNQYAPKGEVHTNITDFDKAKRYVDERVRKYFDRASGEGMNVERGRVLRDINRNIVGAMDQVKTNNLGTLYKQARSEFAGPAETKNQIQLGRDLYHGKADIEDYKALAHDQAAQKRVRLGFHGAFEEAIKENKITHDVHQKFFGTFNQQQAWRDIIGNTKGLLKDNPERFFEYMNRIGRERQTQNIVSGGSPTVENAAVDQASNVLHTVGDIFKGNFAGIGKRALEYSLEKMFGQRADVAEEIARKLFSADKEVNRRTVARLHMMLGQTRLQRLSDIMGRVAAEHAQRAVGTIPGAIAAE